MEEDPLGSSPIDIPGGRALPVDPLASDQEGDNGVIDAQILDEFLRKSPQVSHRFEVREITHNQDLAKAARRELEGRMASDSDSISSSQETAQAHSGRDLEVERQRAALMAIEEDVGEEVQVMQELVALLLERITSGQRSLEGLLALLQATATAESGYLAALSIAADLPNPMEADATHLGSVLKGLKALPETLYDSHTKVHQQLQGAVKLVEQLVDSYTRASVELTSRSKAIQKGIRGMRRSLQQTFIAHKAACETLDQLAADRPHGRGVKSLDLDPWATEGRIVRAHQHLQNYQDQGRNFLAEAFTLLYALEAKKVDVVQEAAAILLQAYGGMASASPDCLTTIKNLISSQAPQEELRELQEAANSSRETAEKLAAKQSESVRVACDELFCSPEIVRQGEMMWWDPHSSRWNPSHFVLTRAGFLHWFRSVEDVERLDGLNLSRCQFEQGKAPVFNMVESGTGGWLLPRTRKITLQAPSVEDCCEWAIAIREEIALATRRGRS